MRTAWIIVIVLLLIGCSAENKLRRAKRLIESAENQGVLWETDTVFSERIVIVPETKVDSVVKVVNWRDTITVEKDRVITRVVVNPSEKVVYIESKCDPDTIRIEVPVAVTKSIEIIGEKPTFWQKLKAIGEKIVMIIVLLFIGYIAGRMKLLRF